MTRIKFDVAVAIISCVAVAIVVVFLLLLLLFFFFLCPFLLLLSLFLLLDFACFSSASRMRRSFEEGIE